MARIEPAECGHERVRAGDYELGAFFVNVLTIGREVWTVEIDIANYEESRTVYEYYDSYREAADRYHYLIKTGVYRG